MPQLDPTWFASQLFWLVVSLVLLYAILSRLVLPPLQEVLARRQQTFDDNIAQAQRLKSEAEAAREEYERTLADARRQAQKLIDDAMQSYKTAAEGQSKALDARLEAQLVESARAITTRKKQLLDGLSATTAELSALIVEKLTQAPEGGTQIKRIVNS